MSFKLLLPGSQAKHENAPSDDLVGQVTYGTAGGDYLQDLEALGGQDGYYNDATQQILTRRQLAIWGGYEHSWADQWHSAFVAGYLLVSNLAIEPADSYKSSIYTDVNITFRPIPRFAISCEYYFGRRTNKDDEQRPRASLDGRLQVHDLARKSAPRPFTACSCRPCRLS